jgi:hypothetical protein
MADIDYASMVDGYDQVEEAPVRESGALPGGWYPLEVAAIERKSVTTNGVPVPTLRLRVFDGEHKGRITFVDMFMGASEYERDKQGNEKKRTPEVYAEKKAVVQGQMKRFMKSLGAQTGAPIGEKAEMVFNFYGVDGWVGKQFMGKLRLEEGGDRPGGGKYDPRNRLTTYAHIDDPKYGLSVNLGSKSGSKGAAVRL